MKRLFYSLLLIFHIDISPASGSQISLSENVVAITDERFLSYTIDTAQLVGSWWWDGSKGTKNGRGTVRTNPFNWRRQRLIDMANFLGPSYLKIGGTQADEVHYAFGTKDVKGQDVITPAILNDLNYFLQMTGADLIFTVNIGPSVWSKNKNWKSDELVNLLNYAKSIQMPIAGFNIGNEVNGYPFIFGINKKLSSKDYIRIYEQARVVIKKDYPEALIIGGSSAYWPILGEPLSWILGITRDFLKNAQQPDVVSWHYYPMQSSRSPIKIVKANLNNTLNTKVLNRSSEYAKSIISLRDRYQAKTKVWLGETGHAQCGGQDGLSNRYASGIWWLDQLGQMARVGVDTVFRQTLSGASYGMIEDATLEPRPDYWTSAIWKRIMGTKVLGVDLRGDKKNNDLRVYAHCISESFAQKESIPKGAIALAVVNLGGRDQTIELGKLGKQMVWSNYLTSNSFNSKDIYLNMKKLIWGDSLDLNQNTGIQHMIKMERQSYGFFVLPNANWTACTK